ncbi:MAG: GNAT family N-acetyltransferase [Actinomycetota bacterium]|nr:GNAT family N-acetyltransferase [Actinomycetota bacterium]
MRVRSLGFATDVAVLRAGGSMVVEDDDHLVVRTPSNPGYWWGNFVLVADAELLAHGVEVFHGEFPDVGHLAIGVDGSDGAVPKKITELGLEADVSVVLTATSVASAGVVDAEVRSLSEDGDWEQLLELRRQDDHPATDDVYQRRRVGEVRRLVESGAGVFLGALREGRLVSTLGVVCDGSGTVRYQHVQTDAGHRRQGLAGHLVAAAAQVASHRWDVDRFVIVADPDGPAINLYRSLGFHECELQVQLARPPHSSVTA